MVCTFHNQITLNVLLAVSVVQGPFPGQACWFWGRFTDFCFTSSRFSYYSVVSISSDNIPACFSKDQVRLNRKEPVGNSARCQQVSPVENLLSLCSSLLHRRSLDHALCIGFCGQT
uniref:Transmembrane protein n=1 Tax=Toxoplasma gondii (strain ATCC 50861 / VEG) TaxID=432359 RepID=A0A0F7URV2_TOXGV|nr:TPA: hypothetical protein BN1205_038960 [Toxoplasma gondii VEG]